MSSVAKRDIAYVALAAQAQPTSEELNVASTIVVLSLTKRIRIIVMAFPRALRSPLHIEPLLRKVNRTPGQR